MTSIPSSKESLTEESCQQTVHNSLPPQASTTSKNDNSIVVSTLLSLLTFIVSVEPDLKENSDIAAARATSARFLISLYTIDTCDSKHQSYTKLQSETKFSIQTKLLIIFDCPIYHKPNPKPNPNPNSNTVSEARGVSVR